MRTSSCDLYAHDSTRKWKCLFGNFRLKEVLKEEIKTTKMVLGSLKKFDKRTAAEGKVKEFAGFIEKTRAEHSKIKPDSLETYMEHPINIYHVIKRMINDWSEKVESLSQVADIDVQAFQASLDTLIYRADHWHRTTDFEFVTLQLISMQAVYLLNITEIATGTLNGTHTDPLTLNEIFSIRRSAYDRNMF
ncbi:prolyl 4-hydroxylase subunit alpha-2-like [Lineus longissimus]|uniref:prolyl 4-hydroxylase subunit alpha-2-like n=1 Tax=Lineus longissimus TaxID=88925 RepID=UPI00315CDB95